MMTAEYRTYTLSGPLFWLLCDRPSERTRLQYHLKTGDYFGVLATALGFVEEAFEEKEDSIIPSRELLLLRDLKKDAQYLHKEYRICEK